MSGRVRGIRFSSSEEKLIEEFLAANPLIDFTTLAKVSILGFIKNPRLDLHAVKVPEKNEGRRNVRHRT